MITKEQAIKRICEIICHEETFHVRIGCSKMSDCYMRDKMIEFLNEQDIIKEEREINES